jgi:signal transduction histidine kinase
MPSSVRARITLIATAVVALALLVASVLIVRMVESDLIETTERALAAELELEASFFDFDAEPEFFEFDADGQFYGLGVFLEEEGFALGSIFDPNTGAPIAEVVIDTELLEVAEIFDPFTGETITDPALISSVEELAFDFRDLDGEEGNLLLVGAVARDEVDESLAAVRSALIIIVPALTALMGLLIWWMVGRALRPVQAISTRVEAITTSSLDQRVPVPGGNDEISGLARVMNGMLSRLQRGDARQRQFAADASHELRSPLSTVRAAAEMIERNPASGRAPQLAADILAEADRMDALIGDLLSLSRVDEETAAHKHRPVDLSKLIEGFVSTTREIQPGVVVLGDETQLRRALENLINNAHRHAQALVALTVRTVEHHGIEYAEVCVEDDGDGVPAELREVIFERFSRLDEARSRDQGGAGLSLVQTIVVRHRGNIAVDDSPNLGGARFTVHIPLPG